MVRGLVAQRPSAVIPGALITADVFGALLGAFALGILWERHRQPPPPSTVHVVLSITDPPDEQL